MTTQVLPSVPGALGGKRKMSQVHVSIVGRKDIGAMVCVVIIRALLPGCSQHSSLPEG
jgi:hypothetical protein